MLTWGVLKFASDGLSPLAHARPTLATGYATVGDNSGVMGTAETVQTRARMIVKSRKVRENMLRGLMNPHWRECSLNHVYNRSKS